MQKNEIAEEPGRITEEQYSNHDCHLGAQDGCKVCVAWAEQSKADKQPKPEYRFTCYIHDDATGDIVVRTDTYVGSIHEDSLGLISCENVEQEVFSLLRRFNTTGRTKYEAENYPQEVTGD